jgi:hypothetical protein
MVLKKLSNILTDIIGPSRSVVEFDSFNCIPEKKSGDHCKRMQN